MWLAEQLDMKRCHVNKYLKIQKTSNLLIIIWKNHIQYESGQNHRKLFKIYRNIEIIKNY